MPDEPGAAASAAQTLLLVEDEESVRRLFGSVLESAGYRVLQAANPREALDVVRSLDGPLDLLITDLIMPDMDGRAVATAVTMLRPACRVVFISGYPSDSAEFGGDIGSAAFLQKPFTPRTLVARVRDLLQPAL